MRKAENHPEKWGGGMNLNFMAAENKGEDNRGNKHPRTGTGENMVSFNWSEGAE